MIIRAATPLGNRVFCCKPDSDVKLGLIKECDTETGWYLEVEIIKFETPIKTEDGKLRFAEVKEIQRFGDFDVIDKDTKEVLYRARLVK